MQSKIFTICIICIFLTESVIFQVNSDYSTVSESIHTPQIPVEENINNDGYKLLFPNPKAFTENCGQLENDAVRFYAQGGEIWFTDDGVWFEVRDELSINSQQSTVYTRESNLASDDWRPEAIEYKSVVLKQEFMGANPVRPMGKEELGYYSNFFYGSDSSKWCTKVPNYQEIFYKNIYSGIDLRYYTDENAFKYDFIIHPGADINRIRIKYKGAEGLKIDRLGNLIIKTKIKDLIDENLYIYQNYADSQHKINGEFKIYNNLEFGFGISDTYRLDTDLVIDPRISLDYSSYIGGGNYDYSYGLAVDSIGNAFVTGHTESSNFPTTTSSYDPNYHHGYDAFIFKFSQYGSWFHYCTYIGGSGDEYGNDIKIDSKGNAYITGPTRSKNFPITEGANQTIKNGSFDVFVLKINPTGSSLVYSTYVGGSVIDEAFGIALDDFGNAFVTGFTESSNFPVTASAYDTSYSQIKDIFIFKLNYNGSKLIYSTYLGGNRDDIAYDIAVDQIGNALITGITKSSTFPTTTNAFCKTWQGDYDCFVAKLNQSGSSLNYSTLVGEEDDDFSYGLELDQLGNALVTGTTDSSDFPTTQEAYDPKYNGNRDIFVLKLNHNGSALNFSTFIGGNDFDEAHDIALDPEENIYITGHTLSQNFPLTPDNFDHNRSWYDSFLVKLSADCKKLLYSTFLGGLKYDHGRGIDLDSNDNIYLTGDTKSKDFPTTINAFSTTLSGNTDIFMVKFLISTNIEIDSIRLFNNENVTNNIYSNLCPYTFRINITDTVSLSDLENVHLNLDPSGSNIQLLWNRSTGQFSKLFDPNNFVVIDPSSTAYNDSWSSWVLDFNVTFNWTYPDENLHKVQAYATSRILSPAWFNTSGIYQVENDLVFNGSLVVTGEDERLINQEDLVRGGEKLSWIGLTTVYEGTTDIYPPSELFEISIWDNSGILESISHISGQPLFFETITSTETNINGYKYTINLTEITPECDSTNTVFTIKIDADNVIFSNFLPDNTTWQTNSNVNVKVDITDVGGGFVDGTSIMYALSKNNGLKWNEWRSIASLNSAISISAENTITFVDGLNNLIKWKAADSLGNGPLESDAYRITVDTENVIFSDIWPLATEVSPTKNVELGITISDKISGVNASMIEYAVSDDNGMSWGSWLPVEGIADDFKVDVYINLTFPNGTDNMIKWRASDIAGNGPIESEANIINVNIWENPIRPHVTLLSPSNALIINNTNIELQWQLEESSFTDVTYDVYFNNFTAPDIRQTDVTTTNLVVNDLSDGEIYYWRVIPKLDDLQGSCSSGIWWFKVELIKEVNIYKINLTCPKYISIYPGENKNVILSIKNSGTAKDMIKLELDAGKLSEYISLNDLSILTLNSNSIGKRTLEITLSEAAEPGNYEIIITAISINSDEIERDSHKIMIEIKEPGGSNEIQPGKTGEKTNERSNNTIFFLLVGIVIIIIVIFVLIAFIIKRKNRAEQKLLTTAVVTVKPSTIPTTVISQDGVSEPVQITGTQQSSPTIANNSQQSITTSRVGSTTVAIVEIGQLKALNQIPQLPPADQLPTQNDNLE